MNEQMPTWLSWIFIIGVAGFMIYEMVVFYLKKNWVWFWAALIFGVLTTVLGVIKMVVL